jgi:hypothetical protein
LEVAGANEVNICWSSTVWFLPGTQSVAPQKIPPNVNGILSSHDSPVSLPNLNWLTVLWNPEVKRIILSSLCLPARSMELRMDGEVAKRVPTCFY